VAVVFDRHHRRRLAEGRRGEGTFSKTL
jgi:hypothetical protein